MGSQLVDWILESPWTTGSFLPPIRGFEQEYQGSYPVSGVF